MLRNKGKYALNVAIYRKKSAIMTKMKIMQKMCKTITKAISRYVDGKEVTDSLMPLGGHGAFYVEFEMFELIWLSRQFLIISAHILADSRIF